MASRYINPRSRNIFFYIELLRKENKVISIAENFCGFFI